MDLPLSRPLAPPRANQLRRLAAARRFVVPVLLALPTLGVLGIDLFWRRGRVFEFSGVEALWYALALLESAVVWSVLLVAASRAKGWLARFAGVAFVVLFALCVGGQGYFFEQYNAYLSTDVSRFATDFFDSVLNQLVADAGNYLSFKGPAALAALAVLVLSLRWMRPRRAVSVACGRAAPLIVLAAMLLPTQHSRQQASTPDVLYLNAMGGMFRTLAGFTEQSHQVRPRLRESLPLGQLTPQLEAPRNVVFVILESVRADATCVDFSADCARTPATNALFPSRVPLRQLRALDSSTAISLAVLWSGVGPNESREVLHTWPLVFDYARAAGYHTAYWTSQNMMFGNVRLWVQKLGVESFLHATDVDPASDIDLGAPEDAFVDRALQNLDRLEEPYFLTVQLSNGHYPYLVDPQGPQPFQPSEMSKAPEDNQAFRNYYQNAVYQEDQHLARLLSALRQRPGGERTVVVYTSDHGEAFREHFQMGHTFSLFDEEVKVPGFVDAPPDTLSEEQMANLRSRSDAFVFHPDLTATVIDLLGVWRDPALARFRAKMLGTSLLEPLPTVPPALPMTNCAGVWSCAFENWGAVRGQRKLLARAWEKSYQCYDLAIDPQEKKDLGVAACGDLQMLANGWFTRLPGKSDD
ncbi:MAG TPA: sulfatase-like hydrolase/transferase [Polyangiaceae bacterium]|nr:sulfatase-like hydrolase/transferase [Polyangiaceae bacterium]